MNRITEVDAKYPALIAHLGLDRDELATAMAGASNKVQISLYHYTQIHWTRLKPYVGTSGGKDSVVIQWLSRQVHDLPTVHTPKPGVTHPKTLEFLYQQCAKQAIMFCPSHAHANLKYDTQIDGTRIAEFDRTDGRSTDFVRDGQNVSRLEMTMWVPNGLFGLNFVYPIYDWSDAEVWACIFRFYIPFSEEYLP